MASACDGAADATAAKSPNIDAGITTVISITSITSILRRRFSSRHGLDPHRVFDGIERAWFGLSTNLGRREGKHHNACRNDEGKKRFHGRYPG
jgi:hypothetical protein